MSSTTRSNMSTDQYPDLQGESAYETWHHWPVNWSAIGVGALGALAVVTLLGLVATALGAHLLGPDQRIVDLKTLSKEATVFSVCGAFFSFVIGGWIAGKIAGILRSEYAMLHGAIVWLVAMPVLTVMGAAGAIGLAGSWYSGIAGASAIASQHAPYDRPEDLSANATDAEREKYNDLLGDYRDKIAQWQEETPKAVRNGALCATTAMLLGLMGSVIGGWMASGEPMTLTAHRHSTTYSTRR